VAKVWRISFESFNDNGVEIINTLHYQTDLGSLETEPSGSNVVDAVHDHLTTAYRACLPTTYTLNSLEAREEVMPSSGDVPASGTKTVQLPGTVTVTGGIIPDAMCAIVKLRTDAAIRSARGYLAMPNGRSSIILGTDLRWATAGGWWTGLTAFAALLDDSFDTGGVGAVTLNPVVYSRTRRARQQEPYAFPVVEAVVTREPRWRRSRTTAP
jgi:hypothetical protein